jgi:energy-converting hydrogenase Eha subunit C
MSSQRSTALSGEGAVVHDHRLADLRRPSFANHVCNHLLGVDANPLVSGPSVALFSLGPTIAVLAAARLSLSEVAAAATLLAVVMIVMWYVFAENDSSTSALIFIWGWLLGVPAAATIVWLDGRRSRRQRGPSQTGPAGHERSVRLHAKGGMPRTRRHGLPE